MRFVASAILSGSIVLAYPLLVFFALRSWSPRQVGFVVATLALIRLGALPANRRRQLLTGAAPLAIVTCALVGATITWDDERGLLLLPVAVNAGLLIGFAATLRTAMPMIERFARMQVDSLSPQEIEYCRRVTIVWCLFFVLNGGISLVLAVYGPLELWSVYTGLISYMLIGLLFSIEYVYRHWRFRRYVGAFTDPILSRLFPPAGKGMRSAANRSNFSPSEHGAFAVPPTLHCWPGHFPDHPVVPGIVQLGWAIERARRLGLGAGPIARVEALKFVRPIQPNDALVLDVSARSRQEVVFGYTRSGSPVASGRLRFADAAVPAPPAFERSPPTFEAPPPADLLPHRGDMVWLARVDGHDSLRTRCEIDLRNTAAHLERRCADGALGAWAAIEWMAQCVSAHDTLCRRTREPAPVVPRIGFLLGTRSLDLHRPEVDLDTRCFVEVEHVWGGDASLAAFSAIVFDDDDRRIASARLSCAIPSPSELANLFA